MTCEGTSRSPLVTFQVTGESGARVDYRSRMVVLALALALAAAPSESGDVAQAKTHFQAGKTHYELGRYAEAIREFAAGYALSPRPEFLINLGQAYRASGDRRAALEMYERYLEKAPANAKAREQVQQIVETLKSEIAAEKPSDAPVKPTLTPAPQVVEPAVAAESPSNSARIIVPVVIGAAVLVGAVIATVVIVGSAPTCQNAPGLGCLDLRR